MRSWRLGSLQWGSFWHKLTANVKFAAEGIIEVGGVGCSKGFWPGEIFGKGAASGSSSSADIKRELHLHVCFELPIRLHLGSQLSTRSLLKPKLTC